MKRTLFTLVTMACLAAEAIPARAVEAISDYSGLIGEFSAQNPGLELALPLSSVTPAGRSFQFVVYLPQMAGQAGEVIHATPAAELALPLLDCQGGTSSEASNYAKEGTVLAAGIHLLAECTGPMGYQQGSNSYVYLADAANPNGQASLLPFPGKRLLAINPVNNLNASGSAVDLMISLLDASSGEMTVQILDFSTGAVYSNNVMQAVIQ